MMIVTEEDVQARMKSKLNREVIRQLARVDSIRSTTSLIIDWVLIAGAAFLCETYFHWSLYLLTVVWIGSRQHGLAILMHDAAHGQLLKSKKWNLITSDLFCAWPLFISTAAYWRVHAMHHRYTATDQDPDWRLQQTEQEYQLPLSLRRIGLYLLRDVSGLGLFQQISTLIYVSRKPEGKSSNRDLRENRPFPWIVVYWLVVLGILAFTGGWRIFVMYWLIPLVTWLKWILYVRALGEHHAFDLDRAVGRTRTVKTNFLERLLIAPHNIAFHVEHHLYPNIPFYRLQDLNHRLMEMPEFSENVKTTRGYIGVFREALSHRNVSDIVRQR